MTTLVLVSDSHGRRRNIEKLMPLFAENDYTVFLGDGIGDLQEARNRFGDKIKLIRGNCDFSGGEEELTLEVDGMSVFCCHGHRYGVKYGLEKLAARARELGCSAAFYGHTHTPSVDVVNGVTLINPGSAGDYADPTYCYVVAHGGVLTPTHVRLNERP